MNEAIAECMRRLTNAWEWRNRVWKLNERGGFTPVQYHDWSRDKHDVHHMRKLKRSRQRVRIEIATLRALRAAANR